MLRWQYMAYTTVTKKDLQEAAKDVHEVVKEARRRLFELETLHAIREIENGKITVYESMDDFWKRKKRKKAWEQSLFRAVQNGSFAVLINDIPNCERR